MGCWHWGVPASQFDMFHIKKFSLRVRDADLWQSGDVKSAVEHVQIPVKPMEQQRKWEKR